MSDELDPTTPPMPEARPADHAPPAPPMNTESFDPLLAAPAMTSVPPARLGVNRTRQIAGVAALAAGVAITAGIAIASGDDTATTSTESASVPVDAGTVATSETPVAADELPPLDARSATTRGVTGTTGAAVDADAGGRVGRGEPGALAFDGARPEHGRGHRGDMGEPGDTAGSAMPAPAVEPGDTATVPAQSGEAGAPDASSQAS